MSSQLHHECTRIPITAVLECDALLVVAEGPYLRFYNRHDNTCLASYNVLRSHTIHGISLLSKNPAALHLVLWGGVLVCTVKITWQHDEDEHGQKNRFQFSLDALQLSNISKAPDWILDIRGAPEQPHPLRCAAVTAHNALLEIALQYDENERPLAISINELTSSSRSILYSAHIEWESLDRVLVAAGTAFGEIIYWSWDQSRDAESRSRVHRVFLGHEGSIYGVQISKDLSISNQCPRRLLASCSDDRTIRIWDVSKFTAEEQETLLGGDLELQRTRHTGFSNASFDPNLPHTDCIAIGWGHTSRVWKLTFLGGYDVEQTNDTAEVFLVSSGEDATSRTWKLVPKINQPPAEDTYLYELLLVDTAASHNGKNIWAMSLPDLSGSSSVTLGGADSKITRFPLTSTVLGRSRDFTRSSTTFDYDVKDIADFAPASHGSPLKGQEASHRSSKQAEFFRSYAFLDKSSLILTTNSGKIFLEVLGDSRKNGSHADNSAAASNSIPIDQLDDLSGYSVCSGDQSLGVVFLAGSKGSLYAFTRGTASVVKLHIVAGKIGDIFTGSSHNPLDCQEIVLLITLVGQKVAQLLHVSLAGSGGPAVSHTTSITIPDQITGLTITSMAHVNTPSGTFALLGFRRGSIAVYRIAERGVDSTTSDSVEIRKIVECVHGKEAVTSMAWFPDDINASTGYVVSTGRDGCIAVHLVDFADDSVHLTHKITLPFGPNIEGFYTHQRQLYVYGFSSKKFVLYNTATEEEVMSVETGGAHRSWAFEPDLFAERPMASRNQSGSIPQGGNILVWTRASSMHIRSQHEPNHTVVRSGGHGREIKAVATSPVVDTKEGIRQLIATGAEDTDIKLFAYEDQHLVCLRTLRKHTTGIQCLQWSPDGSYLFSSGGCEEFYIWKINALPPALGGIGVVCEAVWTPESEHSDLRIMAFDVAQLSDHAFVISMAFSNSRVKVYKYDHTKSLQWQKLSEGLYFTSCLTQCVFIDPLKNTMPHTILTAGTDGHAVLWLFPDASPEALKYRYPTKLHQSSSKTLSCIRPRQALHVIISGGDDGSLSFLIMASSGPGSPDVQPVREPIIVVRAHGSAVTACAVVMRGERILVVTGGNDQWVRLWEVTLTDSDNDNSKGRRDWMEIKRLTRVKTNVADVSSMAVLSSANEESVSRVLVCGVGMEVIAIQWDLVPS
ncbi:WD40 repeat-like protein [Bimuria novae-zelandiae CBS 107.79]|uniref:WD40 repeat-like protein n=1 Tax=Bimuria novae-zelandiae CBS 107.79 TaxID=1447943 RepID=A0A6A5UPY7_9PLEO|nr:WD40 repeat-like protein [Bimuria novae-zelandiae CBS 107.79]